MGDTPSGVCQPAGSNVAHANLAADAVNGAQMIKNEQALAQMDVLGLCYESGSGQTRQTPSPVEGGRTVRLGPSTLNTVKFAIHGSRLQIETGDKILVPDQPTRLKLIEKRRQALIGRVEARKAATMLVAVSCPTLGYFGLSH